MTVFSSGELNFLLSIVPQVCNLHLYQSVVYGICVIDFSALSLNKYITGTKNQCQEVAKARPKIIVQDKGPLVNAVLSPPK